MTDFYFDTIPPQALEHEESLLVACIIDNGVIDEVLGIINPADFYRSAHKNIMAAIITLHSAGEPVDLATLAEQLKKDQLLDKIGGASYLAHLLDLVPMSVNSESYARTIKEKAALRNTIEVCQRTAQRCFEAVDNPEMIINDACALIGGIECGADDVGAECYSDLMPDQLELIEKRSLSKTRITGVTTGLMDLDKILLGLQPGNLYIMAARPGMGKTGLMRQMADSAARGGTPSVVFSLEMTKSQLAVRGLAAETGMSYNVIESGKFAKNNWDKLTDAAGRLSTLKVWYIDTPGLHYREMHRRAKKMIRSKGIGLVFVDYIQLATGDHPRNPGDKEVGSISRGLKNMAKALNVPVVALSQLNRDVEKRKEKRPMLSDLRDSGSLEQDADAVLFIYRDGYYKTYEEPNEVEDCEIIISKHRNGGVGKVDILFAPEKITFLDKSRQYS